MAYNKDGSYADNPLPEAVIGKKLQKFLKENKSFHNGCTCCSNFECVSKTKDKHEEIEIYENSRGSLATGWCLLDDDFEIAALANSGVKKFDSYSSPAIDFSKREHISSKLLFFKEPRLISIYFRQWEKVQSTENETFVRFKHQGIELFSHMFPFMWDMDRRIIEMRQKNHVAFLSSGFKRFGKNKDLPWGVKMNRPVMHSISRHPYSEKEKAELKRSVVKVNIANSKQIFG